jgi:hypothetical protein
MTKLRWKMCCHLLSGFSSVLVAQFWLLCLPVQYAAPDAFTLVFWCILFCKLACCYLLSNLNVRNGAVKQLRSSYLVDTPVDSRVFATIFLRAFTMRKRPANFARSQISSSVLRVPSKSYILFLTSTRNSMQESWNLLCFGNSCYADI